MLYQMSLAKQQVPDLSWTPRTKLNLKNNNKNNVSTLRPGIYGIKDPRQKTTRKRKL